MSNLVVAFFFSLGATAWIYNKLSKRTGGGNVRPAIIGSAVVGLVLFMIVLLTLSAVIKK